MGEPARQLVCRIDALPTDPLEASAAYFAQHHDGVIAAVRGQQPPPALLVLTVPPAGSDHDGWRRALAGDLARSLAPIRCNLIAASNAHYEQALLEYLEGAPGVTGHYLAAHE